MVKPLELKLGELIDRYEKFLHSPGVELLSFDAAAARLYAEIRLDRSIRPPDAIQLACAAAAGTDLFVTNDAHLSRKNITGIDFIVPLQQVYL
jgi:predicted nucleic acid-binding protein